MSSIRKIYVVGDISWEAYERFSKKLTELELLNKYGPIFLELASDGGDAHAALAFSARIRLSSCEILITALGNVASAAVLILASGDHRRISEESWVMVHEDSAELAGSVVELERESTQLRRMEEQWAKLLKENTGTKKSEWEEMHKKTTYLTAQECLELGLVDEVI